MLQDETDFGELKFYDLGTSGNIPVNSTWNSSCNIDPPTQGTLFSPRLGTGYSRRQGNTVFLHRILIKCGICIPPQFNQLQMCIGTMARFILFQNKITNGIQVTGADVLEGVGVPQAILFQNKEVDNYDRIEILKDIIIPINPTNANLVLNIPPAADSYTWPGRYFHFEFDHKFKEPVRVRFNSDSNNNISVLDNSFHIIANMMTTNMAPTFAYTSRCWFTEDNVIVKNY